jgi:hypothetical protein
MAVRMNEMLPVYHGMATAPHSFNVYYPENPLSTKAINREFDAMQQKFALRRGGEYKQGSVVHTKVSNQNGVRNVEYQVDDVSNILNRMKSTVRDTITRLQLPIDSLKLVRVFHAGASAEKEDVEVMLVVEREGKLTTITINEEKISHNSNLGYTDSSSIFVTAIQERGEATPRDNPSVTLHMNRIPERIGSSAQPSWNSLEVTTLSENLPNTSWRDGQDGMNQRDLINAFNSFISW